MNINTQYTLKQLSKDMGVSIRVLREHVSRGNLTAKKVGRAYFVTQIDYDRFKDLNIAIPRTDIKDSERNYLCRYYDECLDKAALANTFFDCKGCTKFCRADRQVISPHELAGVAALWKTVFDLDMDTYYANA